MKRETLLCGRFLTMALPETVIASAMPVFSRLTLSAGLNVFAALILFAALTISGRPILADQEVDYERDVRPLLQHKCAACHGALKQSAGLRLDAGQLIHQGGENGPVIDTDNVGQSAILKRVTATDAAERMPPAGEGESLNDAQVQLLSRWMQQGAKFPQDEKIPEDPLHYWSYRTLEQPEVPSVARADWIRNPIDAFIAEQHQVHGLSARGEASCDVWLRRVCLDLIGLPPTREQLHAFREDTSADAYEKVVDQLLERPEYGERWGRHWMDVWRYSDWYGSRGINEIRYSQRHIWRWRDWIVESLNADKPYDQMIVEMLAGDELAPSDPNVLRATGFLGRNWYKFDRNVWMFETVEQTSQAFLGLTLKCARCHDHKFDPITQEDYYRFRAFFEPHDVRTDPLSGDSTTEKDATLGAVLKAGVARVYDKQPDVPTYIFQRGDNRYPDESRKMTPGVPKALLAPGAGDPHVAEVQLPADAWYPALRPEISADLQASAEAGIVKARDEKAKFLAEADRVRTQMEMLRSQLAAVPENAAPPEPTPVLHDDFSARSDVWKVLSGDWKWQDGKLTETAVKDFATVVANVTHPRNFTALVRYRTLPAGGVRSVGFSFDYVDQGNSQDIYTATGDAAQSVQAFHRKDGQQHYPTAGIVKTPIRLGEVTTVEITVREQQLTIRLNGEHKLDYVMPESRREGRFALWVHSGTAEFLEVKLKPLVGSLAEMQAEHLAIMNQAAAAEVKIEIAELQLRSLQSRLAAEKARYGGQPEDVVRAAALKASQDEKQVAVGQAKEVVLHAEQIRVAVLNTEAQGKAKRVTTALDSTADSNTSAEGANNPPAVGDSAINAAISEPAGKSTALEEADRRLEDARQKLGAAEAAVVAADGTYSPLGETFPKTSSGRRLALARWIASSSNPRTSRVAVNQIWMRHFGQPLVPTVANFGLNGAVPTHPKLLDWLAVQLISNGWKMKPLHRLIVLSATYRQSSVEGASNADRTIDPNNRFLWRMNSRRMEAEVVRDSVLAVSGSLDKNMGGPEIPESDAESNFRRSLYFRITPNEKAALLETFDLANPNECYRRQESVIPQQALALMNSGLAIGQARMLAGKLTAELAATDDQIDRDAFISAAFETILSRTPDEQERQACLRFLQQDAVTVQSADLPVFPAGAQSAVPIASAEPWQRARENMILVLISHNDFVTIR